MLSLIWSQHQDLCTSLKTQMLRISGNFLTKMPGFMTFIRFWLVALTNQLNPWMHTSRPIANMIKNTSLIQLLSSKSLMMTIILPKLSSSEKMLFSIRKKPIDSSLKFLMTSWFLYSESAARKLETDSPKNTFKSQTTKLNLLLKELRYRLKNWLRPLKK